MNALDLLVVGLAAGAGWLGWRTGFVHRSLSWSGLALGLVVALLFVPDVAEAFKGSPPRTRLLVSLGFVLAVTSVLQAVGAAFGVVVRRRLPATPGVQRADRIAGSALGVVGVLVVVWLLIPALASSPGWPARAARSSALIRTIDRWAPAPPEESETLGRLVGDQTFPEVFDTLTSPDAGDPPAEGIPAAAGAMVARSTVKVAGTACDRLQEGTGFVAGSDLVVTNAHVVAGESRTRVDTADSRRLDAEVVAFDPQRDLAVLYVPGLGLPVLERATAHVDEAGALFGHPGGGDLREAPVRIAEQIVARGTDITHTVETEREVFVLAAVTAPGDSGGPIVDRNGRVVGVMFAYDVSGRPTAYALTRSELDAVLDPVVAGTSALPRDTGDCLAA